MNAWLRNLDRKFLGQDQAPAKPAAVPTEAVFVTEGIPRFTYNPRGSRNLEAEVTEYLNRVGKALSISGPSKCGKTVLVKKLLPEDQAIWLVGSDITSPESFWRGVVDRLNGFQQVERSHESRREQAGAFGGGTPISLSSTSAELVGERQSQVRTAVEVARRELQTSKLPVVIDDFHYVPAVVRTELARTIKSLIPTTHVILIAAPYEALQAVESEPDMGGRVRYLRLEPWSTDELAYIAREGFRALNVQDHEGRITAQLAANSFGAPSLMQDLCYEIASSNGIASSQSSLFGLVPPPNWHLFFRQIAANARPAVVNRILNVSSAGPSRAPLAFKDGSERDIYLAVMLAVARLGPSATIHRAALTQSLRNELVGALASQRVVKCLERMSQIALDHRGSGDPALVYKNDELHVIDPYLAFFLTWAELQ
ncbi:MAG: ATP-binding protein [Actinomycetes bacterium]